MKGMPRPPPRIAVGSDAAHERLAGYVVKVKGLDMTVSCSRFLRKVF
jgi:hypothetical protein